MSKIINNVNLKIGERYSVILPNGLIPVNYQGTLTGYYFSKFAQHENALYIFLKLKGARKNRVQRIIISKPETAIILKGWDFKEIFRKELVKENENVTLTHLHRLKINDFKPEQVVLYKEYGQEFQTIRDEDSIEGFLDYTTSYCCNNNIRPKEATTNENYINYIKQLLREGCYNVDQLLKQIKAEGYSILEKCLNLAIQYNW